MMAQRQRKVLILPYISKRGVKTRFLVAQDDATGDWTFLSGTCEPREPPRSCVVRELCEETKGLVCLTKLPKRTKSFRIVSESKRIDVFFVPLLRDYRDVPRIFDELPRVGNDAFDENRQLRFETLGMFRRRKTIWSFIRGVMQTEEFLTMLPPRSC